MKKHLFTLLSVMMMFAINTDAQTLESKFGLDSAKTVRNASIYQELVKQKNYSEALPSWRYVFKTAPKFQKLTYSRGVYILRYMIKKTKNPKYVDSLLMLYDQRIKYFGDASRYGKHWILGRKGSDCYRYNSYRKGGVDGLKEAYSYLSESVDGLQEKTEPSVLSYAMTVSTNLLEKNILSKEDILANYEKYMTIVEKQIKVSPKNKVKLDIVKSNIETLFFDAGVADCVTLTKLLSPKFEKFGDNLDELKGMVSILKRSECHDGELYAKIAEKIYSLEPNAGSAYDLAIMFLKKDEYGKTEKYLNEAIANSADINNKTEYLIKLATIKYSQKKYREVKQYCAEALKLQPNKGRAYILIGQAYASFSKSYSTEAYDQHTVFWVAVDKFIKARSVDPSIEKEASELIKRYSVYFPNKEEAFFRNVKPGDRIKLTGWINETTSARFKK